MYSMAGLPLVGGAEVYHCVVTSRFIPSTPRVMTATMFGTETKQVTAFTVRGSRRGRYLAEWSTQAIRPPGVPAPPPQAGAVWNGGGAPSIYRTPPPAWAVEASDQVAVSMATGISAGIALLPLLVTPVSADFESFPALTTPVFGEEESIDGEPCWKVTGASTTSARERLKALSGMAGELMKGMSKHAESMQGGTVVDHRRVRLNASLSDDDFTFAVPPETPKADSLLQALFAPPTAGGTPGPPVSSEE
jgi:hypothetical protein